MKHRIAKLADRAISLFYVIVLSAGCTMCVLSAFLAEEILHIAFYVILAALMGAIVYLIIKEFKTELKEDRL